MIAHDQRGDPGVVPQADATRGFRPKDHAAVLAANHMAAKNHRGILVGRRQRVEGEAGQNRGKNRKLALVPTILARRGALVPATMQAAPFLI